MPDAVRIILAHPSPLFAGALGRALAGHQILVLAGQASNGRAALELIERARPDVICCAAQLPIVAGAALASEVMSRWPTPILALQDDLTEPNVQTLAMLAAGAVDWALQPHTDFDELLIKIARAARVRVFRRRGAAIAQTPLQAESLARPTRAVSTLKPALLAIGASTGGPPVLLELLRALAPNSAPPTLCVQHIARGFLDELVAWLGAQCRVSVQIAHGGEVVRPGTVYFPAENHHLEIAPSGQLSLSQSAPLMGHRPAVDVTFASVARSYGARALGILLTGMGADGAAQLAAIRAAGGITWAQSPETCVVAGMPGKAIEMGAAGAILTPAEMVERLKFGRGE